MGKNTRTSNGQGHTYKVGSSYKTVIRHKGVVVTATAPTAQLRGTLPIVQVIKVK